MVPKHGNRKNRKSAAEQSEKDQDWELVPSSSFSDWKLEQNPISGFLTLIKNFVSGHTINLEQLMRGGGVAIIGKNHYIIQPPLEGVQLNILKNLRIGRTKPLDYLNLVTGSFFDPYDSKS